MDFIQDLARNLLASIDYEKAAKSSYSNYHCEGLHYVNLFRDERITVKMYIVTPQYKPNSMGWAVWPHNHSYCFHHYTILGCFTNHAFNITGGNQWNLFCYDTPFREGGKGLSFLSKIGLAERDRKILALGEGYYLQTDEVHTISVSEDWNAAILIQYHDTHLGPTMMFSKEKEPDCSFTNLYRKMNAQVAIDLIKQVKNKVKKGIIDIG